MFKLIISAIIIVASLSSSAFADEQRTEDENYFYRSKTAMNMEIAIQKTTPAVNPANCNFDVKESNGTFDCWESDKAPVAKIGYVTSITRSTKDVPVGSYCTTPIVTKLSPSMTKVNRVCRFDDESVKEIVTVIQLTLLF